MAVDESRKRISRCYSQQGHQEQENVAPLISDLPDHILRLCLEGLDANNLAVAACVCKQWRQITSEEYLWKKHCLAVFGAGLEQFHEMKVHSWKKLYEINHLRVTFGREAGILKVGEYIYTIREGNRKLISSCENKEICSPMTRIFEFLGELRHLQHQSS